MNLINRQQRVFETGFTKDLQNKQKLYWQFVWLIQYKKYKSTLNKYLNKYQDEVYNDISFDVIKRGPLVILVIGLPIAIIGFVLELANIFLK